MFVVVLTAPLVFDPRPGFEATHPRYLILLLGAGGAAALLALSTVLGARPWTGNWLVLPVALLVVSAGLSAVRSDHRRTAIVGFPGLRHGLFTTTALALVFLAAVAAFRTGYVRRLLEALWFGAGGGVLLFGLGQLQDSVLSPGDGWDWARPGVSPWTIGSTLGNPNHLSSFLAMLLPVGIVLGATASRGQRRLIGVMAAVAIAELGITSSRGGILGALTGLLVLALLFRRDVVRHPRRVALLGGGAVVLVAVVVLVFSVAGVTKLQPDDFFRVGTGSTADLRFEVWRSAGQMALDHPVFGVGPDVFPVLFLAYASDRFKTLYGPFTVANGAHNLFFDAAADQGTVGVVVLVCLLMVAALGLWRGWRRVLTSDRERRLLLGGTVAGLVAYVVQAGFNTDHIALSLCFWVLLASAVVLAARPPQPASDR